MKKILLKCIQFYQKHMSPALPPMCRYSPTCSAYAVDAITQFGAVRGSFLALCRFLRCNPFVRGGYDPVPERFWDAFRRRKPSSDEEDV